MEVEGDDEEYELEEKPKRTKKGSIKSNCDTCAAHEEILNNATRELQVHPQSDHSFTY